MRTSMKTAVAIFCLSFLSFSELQLIANVAEDSPYSSFDEIPSDLPPQQNYNQNPNGNNNQPLEYPQE